MMSKSTRKWTPDYASPPGWLLEEYLKVRGYSQAELARRCGLSLKLISDIIAGKAQIEPETALQFEEVFGLSATVWENMEAIYQLQLDKEAEAKKVEPKPKGQSLSASRAS